MAKSQKHTRTEEATKAKTPTQEPPSSADRKSASKLLRQHQQGEQDDFEDRIERWLRGRSVEAKLTAVLLVDLLNGDIGNEGLANQLLDDFAEDVLKEHKPNDDQIAMGAWIGMEIAKGNL